jgi:recombination protein RecA
MEKEKKEINKEKLKALEITLGKIEKDFGRGTIMKLGDNAIENIQTIPSGSIGLDAALGIGGFPRGRVIEIYGPESSGKTHSGNPCNCRGPESWRHCCYH